MKIKRWMVVISGLFGLIGFFYFYDFNKYGHGLEIENHSDTNITILKIVNDDKAIIFPTGKLLLEPKPHNKNVFNHYSDGGCGILTSGRYTPGTLQLTIKNDKEEIKTVACVLKRSENMSDFSDSEFVIQYMGNDKLICKNRGFEGAACDPRDPKEGIQIIDVETSY